MQFSSPTPWLDDFVLASVVTRSGRASEFYRAARAGRFVRLAEGVFLPAATWTSLTGDERFLAQIHAAARASRAGILFSHFSAAALWRLPLVGQWPDRPEVTVGSHPGGQSRTAFAARKYPIPGAVVQIDGLHVTTLARTLIDLGRTALLATSVAMMDRALAAITATDGVSRLRA